MNAYRYLAPLTRAFTPGARRPAISKFGVTDILGWAGRGRRRHRTPARSAWMVAGLAAAAAALFAPSRGRDFLRRAQRKTAAATGR